MRDPKYKFAAGSNEFVSKHIHVICQHSYDCAQTNPSAAKETCSRVYCTSMCLQMYTREYDQPTQ